MGGDVFFYVRLAFWALQGRASITISILSESSTGNSHCKMGVCSGMVVDGALSHAGEDI
jgi:hypothetical protein